MTDGDILSAHHIYSPHDVVIVAYSQLFVPHVLITFTGRSGLGYIYLEEALHVVQSSIK